MFNESYVFEEFEEVHLTENKKYVNFPIEACAFLHLELSDRQVQEMRDRLNNLPPTNGKHIISLTGRLRKK